MSKTLHEVKLSTPLGPARALVTRTTVWALGFEETWPKLRARVLKPLGDVGVEAAEAPALALALDEYFDGHVDALRRIDICLGGTDFQKRVWIAVCEIPAGQVLSYSELAAELGSPGAARAVGTANGRNPFALVIPCHRLVGSNGDLTGYAWGLERKRWLLKHERDASQVRRASNVESEIPSVQPAEEPLC